MYSLLPPANEVCEGHVFTGVCLSTRGVCPIACWDTHTLGPEQTHPRDQRQTPPRDQRQTPPRTRGRYPPQQIPLGPEADTSQDQRQTPPQDQRQTPLGPDTPGPQADTPQSRDPLGPKADTPRTRHPLGSEADPPNQTTPPPPPSVMHAGRCGQQACGTHPIGMHSCLFLFRNIFSHRSPLQETSETCEFLIIVRFV